METTLFKSLQVWITIHYFLASVAVFPSVSRILRNNAYILYLALKVISKEYFVQDFLNLDVIGKFYRF